MKVATVSTACCLAATLAWSAPALAQGGVKSSGETLPATLQSLDGSLEAVQFEPTEISIDGSVPWKKHPSSKDDVQVLQYTKAKPRTLKVEMLFDGSKSGENVHAAYIAKLEAFMRVPKDAKQEEKRPPLCRFTWGSGFPSFTGVVESLSVKYTRFRPDGTPVRAEATLEMKQAQSLRVPDRRRKTQSGGAPGKPGRTDPSGSPEGDSGA